MNWCDVKVSDYPIPVPIKFFNCLLATGSSTPDILNLPGLSIDPEWDSMFPIRPGFETRLLIGRQKSRLTASDWFENPQKSKSEK